MVPRIVAGQWKWVEVLTSQRSFVMKTGRVYQWFGRGNKPSADEGEGGDKDDSFVCDITGLDGDAIH